MTTKCTKYHKKYIMALSILNGHKIYPNTPFRVLPKYTKIKIFGKQIWEPSITEASMYINE
jgi:hypothetical protein